MQKDIRPILAFSQKISELHLPIAAEIILSNNFLFVFDVIKKSLFTRAKARVINSLRIFFRARLSLPRGHLRF